MCDFAAFVYAVFIFAHAPAALLPAGISALLIGTLVLNMVLAFGGKLQPVIAGPQDTVAVLMLVIVSAVVASLGTRNPQAVVPTVLVLMLIASVALGATYFLAGYFHLGQFIRYLPYPVIGGFLVGTGWFLLVGGFGIATATPVTGLADLSPLVLAQVGAAVVLTVLIVVVTRLIPHALTMILALAGIMLIFYALLWLFHVPVAQARADGWLLGAFPSGALPQVRWIGALGSVDWGAIVSQSGNIVTLAIINVVGLLLSLAGLEVSYQESADVDQELRTRGIANMLAGLAGGLGGFDYVIFGVMAHRSGARSRRVPLVAALTTLVVLFGGSALLGLVPRFILAGMMFLFGLGLLVDWLVGMWSTLPRLEYGIVVLIAVVVAVAGFFQGLVVGIIAAVVLFAINYSRTGVIKHEIAGTAFHSNVDRPLDAQRLLQQRSSAVHIYELQGFLFFGTAYSVLQRVRQRLTASALSPLRYAVIDFRHVSGMDSSAVYSFTTLRQLTEQHGVLLMLTHLTPPMRKTLKMDEAGPEPHDGIAVFDDVDHALEWCEDDLLADQAGTVGRPLALRLAEALNHACSPGDLEERLLAHLERMDIPKDGYLAHQGEATSEIYLISTGRVAVMLTLPDGQQVRLRVMNAGTLIGELSFYRQTPRSASVVALEPTTGYRITWEAIAALQARDPAIVAAFHAYVARVLSERLSVTNDAVAALLR